MSQKNRWTNIISEGKPKESVPDPTSILCKEDFKPHWIQDLTDDEYHGDKRFVSSSNIKKVLESKRIFYNDFFLGEKPEEKEHQSLGKLVHMAFLEGEKFRDKFVVMPKFSGKTTKGEITYSRNCKEVKDKEEAWLKSLPADAVKVTEEEREQIIASVYSVLDHPDSEDIFKDSLTEVSGFYVDKKTGIKCKIRPDILSTNCLMLGDLKTSRRTSSEGFWNDFFDMGYHISMFMYAEGIKEINGIYPEVIPMVVIEKKMPFECQIHKCNMEDLRDWGADFYYRKALDDIKAAIDSGDWHQKQRAAEQIEAPAWYIHKLLRDQEKYKISN